jgi:nucleoside-diphosphate-sugar epimerase
VEVPDTRLFAKRETKRYFMTKVLVIGGTGEISLPCVAEAARLGLEVTVFNRGKRAAELPDHVTMIEGDLRDVASYRQLADQHFDVVCQFIAFDITDIERDVAIFGGRCAQYVFISTASAYQKPPKSYVLTESTPLGNPFWPYSQLKADMEAELLKQHRHRQLNVTIVRPSHTVRTKFPGGIVRGDDWAWRMRNGKPILVHGDGTALWTLTHAHDFARPFVKLLGNEDAFGESFHITRHLEGYTWNEIFHAMAASLSVEATVVHVPTDLLVRYNPEWAGPLYGDKSHSTLFDNSKVMQVAGPFSCEFDLQRIMRGVSQHYLSREPSFDPDSNTHQVLDRIAADIGSLPT